MARANKKGWEGEKRLCELLEQATGLKWFRTPSQEMSKKTRFGDCNPIPRQEGLDKCVLQGFMFDAQKADKLTPVLKLKKLQDDMKLGGTAHGVYFGEETSGTGTPNLEIIAITAKDFVYIIRWLQEYHNEHGI